MGPTAAAFWGHPSDALAVLGVTGTSGKTTTTHLLGAIADACGSPGRGDRHAHRAPHHPGGARAAGRAGRRSRRRAAPPWRWRSRRTRCRWAGCSARGSPSPCSPTSPTTTSTSTADLEDYFEAKARLFRPDWPPQAVVNGDDPYGARLAAEPLVPTEVYRLADASDLEVGPQRCRFRWRGADVQLPLGGRFNVANALAAATAAAHLGLEPDAIAAGLSSAPPVPGRFEPVDEGQPFAVIVDYAHKPGALESALAAAREAAAGGRVLLVFGAGGDRDASKRPEMGEVATRSLIG